MRTTRTTRSDIASFNTVYRDTGKAIRDAGCAVWQAGLMLVLIPVHLLLWLWLPELGYEERERREEARREWADADV